MLVSVFSNALFALLLASAGLQDPPKDPAYVVGDAYPLTTCVVSGEALGSMGDVIEKEVQGRKVKLCCKGCVKAVDEAPEKILAKLDAAIVAAQLPTYPLTHCVVMTQKELGAMGDPVNLILGDRLVRLCCEGCAKRAKRDQEKIVRKVLDAVHETQAATYPLATCVVSGEELGAKPVDIIQGGTLIRVCCKGCVKKVAKKPHEYVAKVEQAREEARKEGGK